MALPLETIWQIEPHTAAKHKILRKYLDAWFPILAARNTRIVYIDGFSGPGRYTGGEPGSPIIALQAALLHRIRPVVDLVFLFVEDNPKRADYLESEIAKLQYPENFKVKVERGMFDQKLATILDDIDRAGHQLAPTFALIDPFGYSGLPYALIQRLLSKRSCEVLITFMADSINRWLAHPDEDIRAHIVETFGTDEAIKIAGDPNGRLAGLKDLYYRQLKKAAKFVRYFELRNSDDRVVYYLFFASNNALGHLKMKEAMWKVDPMGDFTFSDATDPNQQILFPTQSSAFLTSDLVSRFHGSGQIPVQAVETYVNDETGYLRKHMGESLGDLESKALLVVNEFKAGGTKRRAGTYPNDALVTFL